MYEERSSISPYIQLVWRAHPQSDSKYVHSASEYWSFFFKFEDSQVAVLLSGPASKARSLDYAASGEYWGIVCKPHVFIPSVAKKDILDINVALPMIDAQTFIFDNDTLSVPTYETAEKFIELLVQKKHIVADALVAKALTGKTWMSKRSVQRYVLSTTGLTRRKTLRIQQARKAFALLQQGKNIAEVAASTGYVDQSHLTKSLRLLAGQTPAQILSDYQY